MPRIFWYTGWRHLWCKPCRTALTILGITLGVALYSGIHIINQSTLSSFKETVESLAGKASLTVVAGDAGFPDNRVDVISRTVGVKAAVPMVSNRAFFAAGDDPKTATETLVILGVDLLKEQSVRAYKTSRGQDGRAGDEQVIDDPLVFLNQPDSVILSHSFAAAHDLHINSTFDIASSTGRKKLTVRGLLTPEGPARAYGGALAIMDIDGARATFGKEDKVDRVDVVAAAGNAVEDLANRLRKNLGPGYSVERPQTQSMNVEKMVGSFQALLQFLSTIALLSGIFFVSNTMSTSVAERAREIGILRALGATRAGVLGLFIVEAAAVGFTGSAMGVWIGRGVAALLVKMVARSMSIQYLTRVEPAALHLGAHEFAVGILIGTGASILAALWPSIKASAVSPLAAMKGLAAGDSARESRSRFSFSAGIAVTLYFVISSLLKWGGGHPWLGVLSEVSSIIGPALLAPSAVSWMTKGLRILALGAVGRLAKDNLTRNARRTGSNVTTLIIGLVLVIIIGSLNSSFKSSISTWIGRTLRHDLVVTSYGDLTTSEVQPLREDLGAKLIRVAGVKKSLSGFRFTHLSYGGKQLSLKAFDPPGPGDRTDIFDVPSESGISPEAAAHALFQSAENTVLVSQNFASHFNKKTGDTVSINTPLGTELFKVVGLVVDYASPEGVVYMSRDLYKKFWSDKLVDGFGLYLLPGFDLAQVRAKIDQIFGRAYNVKTLSNADIRSSLMRNVDESLSFTRAIEFLAVAVALLSLVNAFLLSVMERTKELGTLRAIGMSRGQIALMIFQEAVIQGGFGAVAAVSAGAGIAYLWVTHCLSQLIGWIVPFSFPWAGLGLTAFIAILVSILAGLYPAYRAAHIEIAEALTYEG